MKNVRKVTVSVLMILLTLMAIAIPASAEIVVNGKSAGGGTSAGTTYIGSGYYVPAALSLSNSPEVGYRYTLVDTSAGETYSVDVLEDDAINVGNTNKVEDDHNYHLAAKIEENGSTTYYDRQINKYDAKKFYSYSNGNLVLNSNLEIYNLRTYSINSNKNINKNELNGNVTKVSNSKGNRVKNNKNNYCFCYASDLKKDDFTLLQLPETEKKLAVMLKTSSYIDPVLAVIAEGKTLNTLSAGEFVLIEPLYPVTLDNVSYNLTETEIGLYGAATAGVKSEGNDKGTGGKGWQTIWDYTNAYFADDLYVSKTTSDSFVELGISNGSEVELNTNETPKAHITFGNLLSKGYGLAIATNTTAKYTLTFNANGGTFSGNTTTKTLNYQSQDAVTLLSAPTRDGYTFDKWKVTYTENAKYWEIGDTYIAGKSFDKNKKAGNATLTAQWTANTVTVNVKRNGELWSETATPRLYQTVNGKDVMKYELKYDGETGKYVGEAVVNGTYKIYVPQYYQGGWSSNYVYSGISVTVKNNKVTKTVNYYSLTVNKDDDVATVSKGMTMLSGQSAKIAATMNSGCHFNKWTCSTTKSKITNANNASTSVKVNAATTVTASGEKNTITVNFTRNGVAWSTGATPKLYLKSGSEYKEQSYKPSASTGKYVFSGVPNGTYKIYVQKTCQVSTWSSSYVYSGKSVTIKNNNATQTVAYYSLTVTKGDNIASVSKGMTVFSGQSVSIEATANSGCVFSNWTCDTTKSKISAATKAKTSVQVNAETTVTANAGKNKVTVYVYLDGKLWSSQAAPALVKDSTTTISSCSCKETGVYEFTGVPNGKYSVTVPTTYDTKNSWQTRVASGVSVSVDNKDTSCKIYYYQLTVAHDDYISAAYAKSADVTSICVLNGKSVSISCSPKNGCGFGLWKITSPTTGITSKISNAKSTSTQVTVKQKTTVNATGRNAVVTVNVYLDGKPWNEQYGKPQLRKDSTTIDPTSNSNGVFTFVSVPNGTYDVYAPSTYEVTTSKWNTNYVDSKINVKIANNSSSVTINYYTLKITNLVKQGNNYVDDPGISSAYSGGTNSGIVERRVLDGVTCTIRSTLVKGYNFAGWSITTPTSNAKSVITDASLRTTKIKINGQATTVNANSAIITYTITYDVNGGTFAANSVTSKNYTVTDAITINPAPTKTGYSFKGWIVTDSDNQTDWKSDSCYDASQSISAGKTGNVTLEADWEARNYTITYDLNEGTKRSNSTLTWGTNGKASVTYTINDKITIESAPTRTGMTFAGWKVTSNTSGTWKKDYVYSSGATRSKGQYGNVTLTAQWVSDGYVIRYYLANGAFKNGYNGTYTNSKEKTWVNNPTYIDTMTKAFHVDTPEKSGYHFLGWTIENIETGYSGTSWRGYISIDGEETTTTGNGTSTWTYDDSESNSNVKLICKSGHFFRSLRFSSQTTVPQVTFTAHWKKNVVTLNVYKNGDWWSSTCKPQLRQDGSVKYTLDKTDTSGVFTEEGVVNGTYDVYAPAGYGNSKWLSYVDTGINITVNNNNVTGSVYYYTLSVEKGSNISNAYNLKTGTTSVICLKNQSVKITADTNTGCRFNTWSCSSEKTGNVDTYQESTLLNANKANATVTVKSKSTVTASAVPNIVTINVRKDDSAWGTTKANPRIVDDDNTIELVFDSTEKCFKTSSGVPDGTYDIYSKYAYRRAPESAQKWISDYYDTGVDITVNNNDVSATIDYYSAKVETGAGISNTYIYENGVTGIEILKGYAATIGCSLSDSYVFNGWTISNSDKNEISDASSLQTTATINTTATITASAVFNTVTVKLNLDESAWSVNGANPKLYTTSGTEVCTLTGSNGVYSNNGILNGTYKVYVQNKYFNDAWTGGEYVDSGVEITVNNNNVDVTVDYYTLTVQADTSHIQTAITSDSVSTEVLYSGQSISVECAPYNGHHFTDWTVSEPSDIDDIERVISDAQNTKISVAVSEKTTIFANGASNSVIINLLLNNEIWNIDTAALQLIDDNGTIYNTVYLDGKYLVNDIPNGSYTVFAMDLYDSTNLWSNEYFDSGKSVTVDNDVQETSLNYYTLTVSYDSESILSAYVERTSNVASENVLRGMSVNISANVKSAYCFKEWEVTEPEQDSCSEIEDSAAEQTIIFVNERTTVCAEGEPNSVKINVFKNDIAWNLPDDAKPKLYQNETEAYTLTSTSEDGVYVVSQVEDGTYDIYVKNEWDGTNWYSDYENRDATVTVEHNNNEITINYYTLEVAYDSENISTAGIQLSEAETVTSVTILGEEFSESTVPEVEISAECKEGYDFKVWLIQEPSSDPSSTIDNENDIDTNVYVCQHTIVYATGEIKTYNVVYDANGGENAPSAQVKEFNKDITLSSEVPTRIGYLFDKWNSEVDGEGDSYEVSGNYSNNKDIVLYAQWTPISYVINYYLDGVECPELAQECFYDEIYSYESLPIVEEESCIITVSGWWENSTSATGTNFVEGSEFSNLTTENGKEFNRYAFSTRTPNTYTITYKWSDGTIITGLTPANYTCGESTTLANVPSVSGYSTYGWYSDNGCSGATTKSITNTEFGNKVFYAKKVANTYTVEYYLDGVKQTELTQTCNYDVTYDYKTVPSAVMVVGYDTFVSGWWTGETAANKGTQKNGAFKNLTDTNGDIIRIYAYTDKTPITYEVKYNGNGATSGTMKNSVHTYDVAKSLTENAYSRKFNVTCKYNDGTTSDVVKTANAKFNGWAVSQTGKVQYDDKQEVLNLTSKSNDLIDLYANWTDGTIILPTPSREGYDFDGWYDGSGDDDKKIGDGGDEYKPTEDITIEAHWKPITYTIEYYFDGVKQDALTQVCEYDKTYSYADFLTPVKVEGTMTSVSAWWTNSESTTGKQYSEGEEFKNLTSEKGKVIKLYSYTEYTITYYKNDGGDPEETVTQTLRFNEQGYIITNPFTREGYSFKGWATTRDGEVVKLGDGTEAIKNLLSEENAVFKYYAIWEEGISLVFEDYDDPYRENTTVYTAATVINGSNKDFDGTVTINIYKAGDIEKKQLCDAYTIDVQVASGESKFIYFSWDVPDGVDDSGVIAEGYFSTTETSCFGTQTHKYETISYETQRVVWDSGEWGSLNCPSYFNKIETYDNFDSSDIIWTENGEDKIVGITASAYITPDDAANKWTVINSEGSDVWYTKSGYGYEVEATVEFDSDITTSDAHTDVQYAYLLIPDKMYSEEDGDYDTLEKIQIIDEGIETSVWEIPETVSDDNGTPDDTSDDTTFRSEYSAVWYPDGEYTPIVVLSDIWTPGGMLSIEIYTNTIMIQGSILDDIYG